MAAGSSPGLVFLLCGTAGREHGALAYDLGLLTISAVLVTQSAPAQTGLMVCADGRYAEPEPTMDGERPIGMRFRTLRVAAGARYLLMAAVCAAAATACGSLHASSPASPAGAGQFAAVRPAAVSLVIKVTGPGAPPRRWTLRCDPVGGTHPDAAKACRVLLHAKNPFAPSPRGPMCPVNAIGARTAIVTGTWFGHPVDATFIQSGCGLPRWTKISQIFN